MSLYSVSHPSDQAPCPYCQVYISARRRPYHVAKCRKNNPDMSISACVFNARHEVPTAELKRHLATCPDRSRIYQDDIKITGDYNYVKGYTAVPPYNTECSRDDDDCENWDDEPKQGSKQIYEGKKRYSFPKRSDVFADEQNETPDLTNAPLRLPRKTPKVLEASRSEDSTTNSTYERCMKGVGRGRGITINPQTQAVGDYSEADAERQESRYPAGRGRHVQDIAATAFSDQSNKLYPPFKQNTVKTQSRDDADNLIRSLTALSIGRGSRIQTNTVPEVTGKKYTS